ncbi:MAG: hypothetical protein N2117_01350 [Anaerolineales bacterium]|nr:hypothetical protein [Anaerolineales bacterium]
MKREIVPLFLLISLLFTACASETPTEPASVLPMENQAVRPTPASTAEPTPSAAPIELSAAADAARRALAELLGVKPEQIEIRALEAVEWPDGCLGLAAPEEICTLAIVPGYRITLALEGVEYVYRTDARGLNLRRELGVSFQVGVDEPRFLAAWQNAECTEQALLLPEGLSFGPCQGTHSLQKWENDQIPAAMADFLARLAPFQAETPAGTVIFDGIGTETATPAEQRAIAEWLKIHFLSAQSGRPEADWGLALTYSRQGGFAGFCDSLKVYLDGSVLLSSCKDVDIDFRLDAGQLERLYGWYDTFAKIAYSQSDPAVADALSVELTLEGQGTESPDQAGIEEILAFCQALIQQGRLQP